MTDPPHRPPTTALWEALRRQEPGAYEELAGLVEACCGPVFRRGGASPDLVQSLQQDVLISVWTHARETVPVPENLRGFLYWRARGVWSRHLRRTRAAAEELPPVVFDLSSESAHALDALALVELRQALDDCRDELEEPYRAVWEARFERGLDPQRSAELLGLRKQQVSVRLHRARQLLEACLRKKELLP